MVAALFQRHADARRSRRRSAVSPGGDRPVPAGLVLLSATAWHEACRRTADRAAASASAHRHALPQRVVGPRDVQPERGDHLRFVGQQRRGRARGSRRRGPAAGDTRSRGPAAGSGGPASGRWPPEPGVPDSSSTKQPSHKPRWPQRVFSGSPAWRSRLAQQRRPGGCGSDRRGSACPGEVTWTSSVPGTSDVGDGSGNREQNLLGGCCSQTGRIVNYGLRYAHPVPRYEIPRSGCRHCSGQCPAGILGPFCEKLVTMPDLDKLFQAIRSGKNKEAVALTKEAIEANVPPQQILDEMIAAMDDVGQRFQRNEAFVPEMLIAARAMKESMALLEPLLVAAGHQADRQGGHRHRGRRLARHRQEPGGHDVEGRQFRGHRPGHQRHAAEVRRRRQAAQRRASSACRPC